MNDARTMVIRTHARPATAPGLLVVLEAPPEERTWHGGKMARLSALTTIGRHPDSTVFLNDSRVSRDHCRIEQRPDGYYLVDHGSANGTTVSGRTVHDARLHLEETIHIGPFRFLFWEGSPDDPLLAKRLSHAGIKLEGDKTEGSHGPR